MKLIIDELESELDDYKSGYKQIDHNNKNNDSNYSNMGINTNRLKQLSVSLNNASLINHLKKENERLRKLVVAYEFKNKRYNEEKNIKYKKNLININTHFYFSIIDTPINTNTNTNTNTNNNSNSLILIDNNDDDKKNLNEKLNTKNNINIINNNKNSNIKKVKETKTKTFKKENKIYKLIKDINNYSLVNSNKNTDNKNQKNNNNLGKIITDNNKKQNNNIYLNKTNIIEKGRTSSVIQRMKKSKINNYANFSKSKKNSKNIFSNNNNKNVLGHNEKNNEKDSTKLGRNCRRVIQNYLNQSFHESLIDKKFNTVNNTGKNIIKENIQNNSNTTRIYDNERSKNTSQDNSLNVSKNYGKVIRRVKTKELKSNQEDNNNNSGKDISLSENKKNNKGHFNSIKEDIDIFKIKILNTDMRKKNSFKQYYNQKHEKVYDSFDLKA